MEFRKKKLTNMKLEEFYSLRKDFAIIGLTGRVGAGCSQSANLLSDEQNARITSDKIVAEELLKHITTNFDLYKLYSDN